MVAKALRKDKYMLHGAGIILVVCTVFMCLVCFEYYKSLRKTLFEESSSYLQELSKQMSANVSKIISDNYAVLGSVSSVMLRSDLSSSEKLDGLLEEQKTYWNFENLMLVDETGVMYDSSGKTLTISNSDYVRMAVVERKRAMSSAQMIDNTECIVFAMPVDGIQVNGKEIKALCASYTLATFDQIIATSAFDGQAYTHIIGSDGAVLVRSSSPHAEPAGYNLITYLERVSGKDTSSLEQMKADMQQGKAGFISCCVDGVERYISYHPVDTEDWWLITLVPLSVVNAKSAILMKITLIFCIFITLVLCALMTMLVRNFIQHSRALERLAFVDPITGGNTMQRFHIKADETLRAGGSYAIVYINIEKFKVANERFGREAGDAMLRALQRAVSSELAEAEGIARVMADHFCLLVCYQDEQVLLARMQEWYRRLQEEMKACAMESMQPVLRMGVYVVDSYPVSLDLMMDRAKLSMNEINGGTRSGKMRYSFYDERVHQKLLREKELEDRMERALAGGEFEVYLQPKYITTTGSIGGAEALVRWNIKGEGMVYPDEFIPLFEKNGFIIQLDLWVFEQVCVAIRRWIDIGQSPVPVSVNCSRIHLSKPDFVDSYRAVFERYAIPTGLLEIELTESVVYEDTERLVRLIGELHEIGFTCSIDDFGSGYSSLNIIQHIPVDTLKLDKIFFRNTQQSSERAKSVIASIVNLAKALSMQTVAEGVELSEQIDMLREVGCDYIQGYVYARPVPISRFEEMAFDITAHN